jgi:squalene synthase HpnC
MSTAARTECPASVETPSGKGSRDENFPVGSFLLARRLRPHVALFYAFARAIDDIADNPALAPVDKIARLDGFEAAITGRVTDATGFEKAYRLRESLLATDVDPQHCVDLVAAFKQDATKLRYRDWDDLMGYCNLSAGPVGRYLLDLHGEDRGLYPASDALCNALQVINHLQDCADDYRNLDRVYLPLDWIEEAGARVEDLAAGRASPALRRVIDRTLGGVESLLPRARELPRLLGSRRLACESSVIVVIAERLTRLLRQQDPLAQRVELTAFGFLGWGLIGLARAAR